MSPSVELFEETKYQALMDGLECCEINKSKLERTLRIDSEFFKKEVLHAEVMLSATSHCPLTEIVTVSDGNHAGISEKFITKGIPYYRGQDAGTFFIENSLPICIDYNTFIAPVMLRSHLKKNDVLLSIVGTIGSLSLVYSNKEATCSCKLAILRPKIQNAAEVLAVFLSSKYGQMQISRYTRGALQKGLILEDMDQLIVPVFGETFNQTLRHFVMDSHKKIELANEIMEHAQTQLNSVYDSDLLQTRKSSISIKGYAESFKKTGRLDAEYYQPKYEAIANQIHSQDTVKTICNIYDKNYLPKKNVNYKYIELANVEKTGGISGVEEIIGKDLPTRARRIVSTGQIIVSSIEGSLQSCAFIGDEYNGALCSTGFYVLDSEAINSETLLVLFKSETIQALMKQRCSGTILTAISKDELLSIPLPIINSDIQESIAAKVQESFSLRCKSKKLLEYAKRAVEIAIEQGEDIALKWLKCREISDEDR